MDDGSPGPWLLLGVLTIQLCAFIGWFWSWNTIVAHLGKHDRDLWNAIGCPRTIIGWPSSSDSLGVIGIFHTVTGWFFLKAEPRRELLDRFPLKVAMTRIYFVLFFTNTFFSALFL